MELYSKQAKADAVDVLARFPELNDVDSARAVAAKCEEVRKVLGLPVEASRTTAFMVSVIETYFPEWVPR